MFVVDPSFRGDPLAWIAILVRGPRALGQEGLHSAIQNWTRRRFRHVDCTNEVRAVDRPPPLLRAGQGPTRDGVALAVSHQGGSRLLAWIASDGSRGSCCIFKEGDEEIATCGLDAMADESEVIGRLCKLAHAFIVEQLAVPEIESWLEIYSPSWRWIEPESSEAVAKSMEGEKWRFAELTHGNLGALVLGLREPSCTMSLEIGVFFRGAAGELVRRHHVGHLESPDGLRQLLEKNLGTDPSKPAPLAPWMLHRVVPDPCN